MTFRERFQREGQIQAGIDHTHIVTVYDSGDSEHGFFIAMRLIRGPNLKDMIVSRELDPGRTLRIVTRWPGALDTAHAAGLIHRDVKPQNILVGKLDQAFLADFGLTKATGEKSLTEDGAVRRDLRLRVAGADQGRAGDREERRVRARRRALRVPHRSRPVPEGLRGGGPVRAHGRRSA